jgi:WD40 repeat protein
MSVQPLRHFLASRTALFTVIPAIVVGAAISSGVSPFRKAGGSKPPDADAELADGPGPRPMIRAIVVSDDGEELEVAQGDAVWQLREAHTGRELARERLSPNWLLCLQLGGQNGLCAGVNEKSELEIVQGGQAVWRGRLPEQGETEHLDFCSLCRHRQRVAVVSNQGSLWLWDFDHTEAVACHRHSLVEPLRFATFSPSGDRLLLHTVSGTFLVWDVAAAHVATQLHSDDYAAKFGAWSGDGRRIITCGGSPAITVWNAHTGQIIRQLRIETTDTSVAELSGDGTLAAAGADDVIQLWNVETGDEFPSLVGHTGEITTLQFADQGRTLFSGDTHGGLRRWSLSHHREVWAVP